MNEVQYFRKYAKVSATVMFIRLNVGVTYLQSKYIWRWHVFPRRYPGNIVSNLALKNQKNVRVKIGEFEFEILLDTTARPYLIEKQFFYLDNKLFLLNFCFGIFVMDMLMSNIYHLVI